MTWDMPLFPWHAAPKQRFVRIDAEELSGRRFHVVERPTITGEKSTGAGPTSPD